MTKGCSSRSVTPRRKRRVPRGRSRSCPRNRSPASHVGEAAVADDDPKAASAVGEAAVAVDGAGTASAIREAAVAVDCAGAASVIKEAAVAADGGGAASESRESAVAADGGGCAASEVVHAAVAAAMYRKQHRPLTSHEGCPTDTPAWNFSSDSASDTETATSVTTFQTGDRVFGDESLDNVEEAGGQKRMPQLRMRRKGASGSPETSRPHNMTLNRDGKTETMPNTSATLGCCLGIGASGQNMMICGTIWIWS